MAVAQVRLGTQLERRVAQLGKDVGHTYKFPAGDPVLETLKEGNRMYDAARKELAGQKDENGQAKLAPPCWGYVQNQLVALMLQDATDQTVKDRIEHCRRKVLGIEGTAVIPPRSLEQYWKVNSTATVTTTKKVGFVELRVHTMAPQHPEDPAKILRDHMHTYLALKGQIQLIERAPAPVVRELRDAATAMGYGKGKGKNGGK